MKKVLFVLITAILTLLAEGFYLILLYGAVTLVDEGMRCLAIFLSNVMIAVATMLAIILITTRSKK